MLLTILICLDCCGNACQIRRTQTLSLFPRIILLLFLLSLLCCDYHYYYYDDDLTTELYLLCLCQSHSPNMNELLVMAAIFVWLWMTCCWTSTRMACSCCSQTGTVVRTRRTCLNGDCWWGPYSACYHQQQRYLDYYYYHHFVVVDIVPLWS